MKFHGCTIYHFNFKVIHLYMSKVHHLTRPVLLVLILYNSGPYEIY